MDNNNNPPKLASGQSKNNDNNSSQQRPGEEENPNLNSIIYVIENDSGDYVDAATASDGGGASGDGGQVQSSRRTPFTNLSQVDADLALARTLQEQERAFMMLSAIPGGSDSGSWVGSYYDEDADNEFDFGEPGEEEEEGEEEVDGEDGYNDTDDDDVDAFDIHGNADEDDENISAEVEFDPDAFSSDEAYAVALQEAEERNLAARLLALAGVTGGDAEDVEDHGGNSQDAWEEVDPDELSYEELLALSEVVGTEKRGLSADTIASLPSVNYKAGSNQNYNGTSDCCVICRVDYEDEETLTMLSCKHTYHSECINNWLNINKVCPVCNVEVSTSGHS